MSAEHRWLFAVDGAYAAMLEAIGSAQERIRLEMYIYAASPIGESFRDALVEARKRGVQVRVLVDALGSVNLSDSFWNSLREAGGEVQWFNPLHLKRLGFRDHRKVLIIDDRAAFIGGFNIAPEYQGDGVTKGWCDAGMEFPASVVPELAASFDAMFALAGHRHQRLARFRRSRVARAADTAGGRILTGAPGLGPHPLLRALLADLSRGQNIDLVSAYFLPPFKMLRLLRKAARSGRRVRLVLAGKTDVALARRAACHLYKTLLASGVEIYEYQPQILHTKLYLIDDLSYVGSANLDKRSLRVNYELLVRIENEALAQEARQFFDTLVRHSQRIEASAWGNGRNFWTRWRDFWAYFVLARVDPYLTRLQLDALRRERDV